MDNVEQAAGAGHEHDIVARFTVSQPPQCSSCGGRLGANCHCTTANAIMSAYEEPNQAAPAAASLRQISHSCPKCSAVYQPRSVATDTFQRWMALEHDKEGACQCSRPPPSSDGVMALPRISSDEPAYDVPQFAQSPDSVRNANASQRFNAVPARLGDDECAYDLPVTSPRARQVESTAPPVSPSPSCEPGRIRQEWLGLISPLEGTRPRRTSESSEGRLSSAGSQRTLLQDTVSEGGVAVPQGLRRWLPLPLPSGRSKGDSDTTITPSRANRGLARAVSVPGPMPVRKDQGLPIGSAQHLTVPKTGASAVLRRAFSSSPVGREQPPTWYYPAISRQEAEEMLAGKEEGEYLVRNSGDGQCYSLSVLNSDRRPVHLLIERDGQQLRCGGDNVLFSNFGELFRHYRKHPLIIHGVLNTKLTNPICKSPSMK